MELRLLRAFEAVAGLMSFNRAAHVLHCTQSTVSAQIKALEEDLGLPVFERLGRRIALTAAGEELLHHTRRLFDFEKEVYSLVRGQRDPTGMLSLRVPQSVSAAYLPRILARFSREYPRVGFDVSNCGYHRLADELRSGVTDAAFLLADCIDAPDLHTTLLRIEPLVFATSPRSGLAKRTSLTIGDLEGHTLLLPKHDCGYRMELERSLKESHVQLATLIELNCLPAMIRCLTEGLGVALLPRITVEQELKERQLVALDWKDALESRLLLLRHRDKPLQGALGAFIKAVEDHFATLARPRGTHGPEVRRPAPVRASRR
jgi:DNA-binding transcriptional LysR family regulator